MKFCCLGMFLLAAIGFAQDTDAPAMPTEFDTYWMVFLKKGDKPEDPKIDAQQLQVQHVGHLTKQLKEGTILVAGPFEVDPSYEIRGIVLYPGTTAREEVVRLAESDPAVKAGHLKVEVLKWWTPKGAIKF